MGEGCNLVYLRQGRQYVTWCSSDEVGDHSPPPRKILGTPLQTNILNGALPSLIVEHASLNVALYSTVSNMTERHERGTTQAKAVLSNLTGKNRREIESKIKYLKKITAGLSNLTGKTGREILSKIKYLKNLQQNCVQTEEDGDCKESLFLFNS